MRRTAFASLMIFALADGLPASAAVLSPDQAVEVLARTDAANRKCQVLAETDTKILSALLRQAERTLVAKSDAETAAAKTAKGSELGTSVRCDETTRAAVKAVMTSARDAAFGAVPDLRGADIQAEPVTLAEAPTNSVSEEAAIGEDESETAKAMQTAEVAKPIIQKKQAALSPPPNATPKPAVQKATMQRKVRDKKTVGQLAAYEALAERYYRERQCRTLSKSSLNALYNQVLSRHRQAVANFGARTVKLSLQRAAARASARGC